MSDWFSTHLSILTNLYGISFVVLGFVACTLPRHDPTLRFARDLGWLGMFGVVRGLLELMLPGGYAPTGSWTAVLGPSLLAMSYIALLEFGRCCARSTGRLGDWPAPVVHGVALAATAAFTTAATDPATGLVLGAKYFIGMPGAFLSGVALLATPAEATERRALRSVGRALRVAGSAFLAYGLLIPWLHALDLHIPHALPAAGTPMAWTLAAVEIARSACALVATLALAMLVRRAGDVSTQDLMRVNNLLNGFVYHCKNTLDWPVTYMSGGAFELTGYRAEEFLRGEQTFGGIIHPDDAGSVWDGVQRALAERGVYELSYRIIARGGEVRWVYERGRGVFDSQGELLYLEGHVINDTVRMETIADLRRKDAAIESSLNAVAMAGLDGTLRYVNAAFCELWGMRREDAVGTPILSLWDDRKAALNAARLVERDGRWQGVLRARRVDGSGADVQISASLFFDRAAQPVGALASFVDVTEQVRLAQELAEERDFAAASQRTLREILDNVFAFVGLVRADGEVLEINQAPLTAAGLERKEVVGQNVAQLAALASYDHSALLESFQAALAGAPVRRDLPIHFRSGREMTLDTCFAPIRDESGGVARVASFAVDVTEQRAMEQQSRRLEAQLQRQQRLEGIGTLAGGIAHDFNNLLMIILGNVDAARIHVAEGAQVAEDLDGIDRAGQRAQELVRQILTFGRRQEHVLSRVRIVPVLEEALKLLRSTLPVRIDLRLTTSHPDALVMADPSQLHQVAMNLVTNAWHAIEDGAGCIELSVSSEVVAEGAAEPHSDLEPGRYVRVDVRDTGIGMEPGVVERAFEPFFTTKLPGQGSGLGLSVVHGILKSHHGAVLLESEPGKGTLARLYFPEAEGSCATSEAPAPATRVEGRGEHILFVDDEPGIASLGKRLLETMGYRVSCYTSAVQALAAFAERPRDFALVITDYSMPALSGVDLARALLRIRPELPILAMSGFLTPEELKSTSDAGIARVMLKPVSFRGLGAAVSDLLRSDTSAGA